MQTETKYHKNGVIHEIIPIKNGKINGVVQRFSEKGFLVREIPYVDGLIHGEKKRYFADGTVKSIIPYVKGQIHGIKRRFNKNGILFETIQYNHGVFVNRDFYDSYYAAGLSEGEKSKKIHQEKIRDAAHRLFYDFLYGDFSPSEMYNPAKIITNDEDDSSQKDCVIERPKEEPKVDARVYALTHPEENGALLKERIDRGIIVANTLFTSETVTSFEITYFKGLNQKEYPKEVLYKLQA